MKEAFISLDENGAPIINDQEQEKEYLLLLRYDSDENGYFEFVCGREEAYKRLSDLISDNDLNVFTSNVIVESVTLADRISVAEFMLYCKEKFYPDDEFDLMDYVSEDFLNNFIQDKQSEEEVEQPSDEILEIMDMNNIEDNVYDDDVVDV